MAESNSNDSDTNENSEFSSQLTEMKENYERKISELQSKLSQLKDLMMAVISKSNNDSPSGSPQGLSKTATVTYNSSETPQKQAVDPNNASKPQFKKLCFYHNIS